MNSDSPPDFSHRQRQTDAHTHARAHTGTTQMNLVCMPHGYGYFEKAFTMSGATYANGQSNANSCNKTPRCAPYASVLVSVWLCSLLFRCETDWIMSTLQWHWAEHTMMLSNQKWMRRRHVKSIAIYNKWHRKWFIIVWFMYMLSLSLSRARAHTSAHTQCGLRMAELYMISGIGFFFLRRCSFVLASDERVIEERAMRSRWGHGPNTFYDIIDFIAFICEYLLRFYIPTAAAARHIPNERAYYWTWTMHINNITCAHHSSMWCVPLRCFASII